MKRSLETSYRMYSRDHDKQVAHRKHKDRLYHEKKLTITEFDNNIFKPNPELSNTELVKSAINFHIRGKNTRKQVIQRQKFLKDYDIKITQGEIGAISSGEFGTKFSEAIDSYIQEQRNLGKKGTELRTLVSEYIYGS